MNCMLSVCFTFFLPQTKYYAGTSSANTFRNILDSGSKCSSFLEKRLNTLRSILGVHRVYFALNFTHNSVWYGTCLQQIPNETSIVFINKFGLLLRFLKTWFWCRGQILIVKCRCSAGIFKIHVTGTSITHNMINHPIPIIYSSFDNFCSYMTSKFTMWFLFLGDKIAITVTISHRVVVNSFCLFFAL